MAYTQKNPLLLAENRTFRGREEINLLVHACRSKPSIFYPFFLILSFFSFRFLSQYLLIFLWFSPWDYYYSFPFLYTARVFYIMPAMTSFYHFAFNYLCLIWVYLLTTTDSSVLAVPLSSPEKEDYFVCLFAMTPLPAVVWMLSLSLSLYPSWHAPSGSISSLLLLGGMSFQQDISPKRT